LHWIALDNDYWLITTISRGISRQFPKSQNFKGENDEKENLDVAAIILADLGVA
jgi:hypothetical protein